MPLAFLAARATRGRTRFECQAEHTEISLCLPRQRTARRVAEIAAVQTEPNASQHVLDVGLGEASVGAARAAQGALRALADAAEEQLAVEVARARMGLHHVSNRHVGSPSLGIAMSFRVIASLSS